MLLDGFPEFGDDTVAIGKRPQGSRIDAAVVLDIREGDPVTGQVVPAKSVAALADGGPVPLPDPAGELLAGGDISRRKHTVT
jgi:hypothetical protein